MHARVLTYSFTYVAVVVHYANLTFCHANTLKHSMSPPPSPSLLRSTLNGRSVLYLPRVTIYPKDVSTIGRFFSRIKTLHPSPWMLFCRDRRVDNAIFSRPTLGTLIRRQGWLKPRF